MIHRIFIAAVFVVSSSVATIANATPKAHLEMEPGLFSGGPKVVVRGKEVRQGIFNPGFAISELMKDDPQAFKYAETHESYAKWSGISFLLGLGGALTYLAAVDSDDFELGTYFAIFGLGIAPAAILHKSSMAYLYKAINKYNGVVPGYSAKMNFSISPVREGAAASLTYSF